MGANSTKAWKASRMCVNMTQRDRKLPVSSVGRSDTLTCEQLSGLSSSLCLSPSSVAIGLFFIGDVGPCAPRKGFLFFWRHTERLFLPQLRGRIRSWERGPNYDCCSASFLMPVTDVLVLILNLKVVVLSCRWFPCSSF